MWKKYQKVKKSQKNISLAIFALGLLLGLIALAKLVGFITSFAQPFSLDLTNKKNYTWDGKSQVNIAFAQVNPQTLETSDVSIISLDPKDQKLTLLSISDIVYTEVPKNYGSWKVGSIYKLGQEENPKVGAELLKLSISNLIGLPIDSIIISNSSEKAQAKIAHLRQNYLTLGSFFTGIKTDLTPFELLRLTWAWSKIRTDKVVALDFAKSSITESKLLPDSSRVLGVNVIRLDTFIRDNLADSALSEENLTVAIFNATSHPGLAQNAARVVTNLGGTVIILSSAQNLSDKSGVYVKDDQSLKDSQTYKRLAEAFAQNCLSKNCHLTDPKIDSSRAQMNVILGEDYYNYWYTR